MVQPNRLFIALLPDPETRAAIFKAGRDLSIMLQPGGRPVREENLHLTLMFLGDTVSMDEQQAAIAAAERVALGPIALTLDHGATFAGNTSTWWLGSRSVSEPLLELRRQLHAAIVERKVPYDRQRFSPHVTIVRQAQSRLPSTNIKPIRWRCEAFSLMRSPLDEPGGIYETLATWPLEARTLMEAGQIPLL